MSRYIDAELLEKKVSEPSMFDINKDDVLALIAEIPTADAVEVVRCMDCVYWTGKDYDGCCIKNGLATRYAKEYCSYGERRSENEG